MVSFSPTLFDFAKYLPYFTKLQTGTPHWNTWQKIRSLAGKIDLKIWEFVPSRARLIGATVEHSTTTFQRFTDILILLMSDSTTDREKTLSQGFKNISMCPGYSNLMFDLAFKSNYAMCNIQLYSDAHIIINALVCSKYINTIPFFLFSFSLILAFRRFCNWKVMNQQNIRGVGIQFINFEILNDEVLWNYLPSFSSHKYNFKHSTFYNPFVLNMSFRDERKVDYQTQ